LVYALIRQESGFNPKAKSPDGARGLMQLMPRTASFMARDRAYRRSKRRKLFDPGINLELGQRYITHLLRHSIVQGNLFRLTAAYNGGPGNLNKWQRKMDYGDDPLLFIESLPSKETRLFIERVLTNLWIYRMRLGQEAPSLDGLAAGRWPLYVPLDTKPPELASNEQASN
jgi:soluble lytic murein transglycosylase